MRQRVKMALIGFLGRTHDSYWKPKTLDLQKATALAEA
jgi:hypothetical protein